MTKAEIRKARQATRAAGRPLTGELALSSETPADGPAVEFTESARGYRARERWARRYDDLNGTPEDDWDR